MSYSFDTLVVKQAGGTRVNVTLADVIKSVKSGKKVDPKTISASLLRSAAINPDSDFEVFSAILPATANKTDAKTLYNKIRSGLNVKENYLWEAKDMSDIHVLCLTAATGDYDGSTVEKIEKACKKQGIKFSAIQTKYAHINMMKASQKEVTIENYDGDGNEVTIEPVNTVAIMRGGVMNCQIGVGTMTVLQNCGVFMVNEKGAMELCANKLQTALALKKHKLPHPKTAFVADESSIDDAVAAIGGKFPVVVKTLTGAEGIGVSIIDSDKSLKSVLQSLWKFGAEIILQEFIPGIKNDVRSIVLNGKLFASAKRDKAKGDFRTNLARGSSGGSIQLTPEEVELVERAARVSKCYYVGVDHIVVGGKPYIIELNASPGSGNVYQLYDEEGKPTKEVDGQKLMDGLVEILSHKTNWKLFSSVAVTDEITVDGRLLVGKIDTGNSGYNSIHATDIKIDEKNHSVSFKLLGKYPMTKKLASRVKVKQGSSKKVIVRPVVYFPVEFQGRDFEEIKFSLQDRSHMKYSVLVGVRFLVQAGVQVDPKEMSADKPLPFDEAFKTKSGKPVAPPKDPKTDMPKKYVSGLSSTQKKRREDQFAARAKRPDSDPKAWEKLPGDPEKTARKSQYSSAYKKKFGKSEEVEEAVLNFIDSDRPMSEVPSLEFKARQRGDHHLAEAYRLLVDIHKKMVYSKFKGDHSSIDEDFDWLMLGMFGKTKLDEVLEVGTNKIVRTYKKDTPGQNCPSETARLNEVADEEKDALYKEWSKLVNMGPKELDSFIDSDEGKEAGLSRKESGKAGAEGGKIKSGRDSARAIVRMLQRKKDTWKDNDWEWAKRQINFINRMKGAKGPMREPDGKPTRKLLALKIWGHDPEK
jgi:RimK family alpha-L-glutamate ligase